MSALPAAAAAAAVTAVVPLFETLDDLTNAPETMDTLLSSEWYRNHIQVQHGGVQEVMIGEWGGGQEGQPERPVSADYEFCMRVHHYRLIPRRGYLRGIFGYRLRGVAITADVFAEDFALATKSCCTVLIYTSSFHACTVSWLVWNCSWRSHSGAGNGR
jgi:hypothetical protein